MTAAVTAIGPRPSRPPGNVQGAGETPALRPVKPETRPYVEAFAPPPGEPAWLAEARRHALSRFAEQGFPSRRSEAWRYVDLRPLLEKPLLPAVPAAPSAMPSGLGFDGAWATMNLLDGGCISVVSHGLPEGIWFHPMRRAISERPDLARMAGFSETSPDHPFTALNTAFSTDGFVLDIAPGIAIDSAIEVVHFASKTGSWHTRSLINMGAGSRATVIETYAGSGTYWRNDVVELRLGDGAVLDRVTLVEEGPEALHLGEVAASLGPRSRLSAFVLLLGGRTVRQDIAVTFAGEGARCRLDGAFVVSGRDEANILTTIDHAAPDGETRETIKGVAAGRGHGAFQGRIIVREGARKVDAQQTSRNLLLGRQAVIDTKPELEILCDDVKCSHGATVGDLDEAALFYLQARGIAQDEARRMLIEAFVRDAIDGVERAEFREFLSQRLSRRLAALEA
jgi:Fe-S cluster assembly protein SufD